MLRVRLSAYLQYLLGSGFAGFNAAFIAWSALIIPESMLILWRGLTADVTLTESGATVAAAALLVLACAGIYALVFNAIFFAMRISAALATHGRGLPARIAPGLAVFVLIAHPLLLFFAGGDASFTVLRAVLAVVLSLGAGLFLIYISPVFRGYNAAFLLFAAVGARIVMFPARYENDALLFLVYALNLLACAFFLFIVLQIRYRLHLHPHYESVPVPAQFLKFGLILAVACAGLYVLNAFYLKAYSPALIDGGVPFGFGTSGGQLSVYHVPAGVYFVCAAQWFLGLRSLRRTAPAQKLRNEQNGTRLSILGSFAAGTLALAAAVLLVLLPLREHSLLRNIVSAGGAGAEMLTAAGMLLDGDRDGNSNWPGGDPDDGDACVRRDLARNCRIESADQADLRPAEFVGDANPDRLRSNTYLFTIVADEFRSTPDNLRRRPVLLSSDRPERSLRALLQGLDGVAEYRGARDLSFPAELARRGVRTICTGTGGNYDYFQVRRPLQLDAGCQIFEPLDDSQRTLSAAVRRARSLRRGYSEPAGNLVWMHYHGRPGEAVNLQDLEDFGGSRRLILVWKEGAVLANAYLPEELAEMVPPYPRGRQLLDYVAGLRSSPPAASGDRVGALHVQPYYRSYAHGLVSVLGLRYPDSPPYTFRRGPNGLTVLDALTGAEWKFSE